MPHTLNRQQIRERKRRLEREASDQRNRQQSLQELTEAERFIEQKDQSRHQMALQTGSLCVALLAQIPEHRAGIEGISSKAIDFLDDLLAYQHVALTAQDPPADDEEDEDEEDEPLIAEAV